MKKTKQPVSKNPKPRPTRPVKKKDNVKRTK
jgi:hypothetical protein